MGKISKSKVVAIALCILIVTQMFQVVTISVRSFASNGRETTSSANAGGSLDMISDSGLAGEYEGANEITNRGGGVLDRQLADALGIDQPEGDGSEGGDAEGGVPAITEDENQSDDEADTAGDGSDGETAPAADDQKNDAGEAQDADDKDGSSDPAAGNESGETAPADGSEGTETAPASGEGEEKPEEPLPILEEEPVETSASLLTTNVARSESKTIKNADVKLKKVDEPVIALGDGEVPQVSAAAGSITKDGITIKASGEKKSNYVLWAAEVSVTSVMTLNGATITVTPQTGHKMYGTGENADGVTTTSSETSWQFAITKDMPKARISYFTIPNSASAWTNDAVFTSNIQVRLSSGTTVTYNAVPFITQPIPSFSVKAADATNLDLGVSGVKFTLSGEDGYFNSKTDTTDLKYSHKATTEGSPDTVTAAWTTPANGLMSFSSVLAPGADYVLKEADLPSGYASALPENGIKIRATISGNDVQFVDPTSPAGVDYDTNSKTLRVKYTGNSSESEIATVVGVENDVVKDEAISGVKFKLYKDTDTTPGNGTTEVEIAELTSDASGKLVLPSGKALEKGGHYYLKEVTPPEGYTKKGDAGTSCYKFNCAADGKIETVDQTNAKWRATQKIPYERLTASITVMRMYKKYSASATGNFTSEILPGARWGIYTLPDGVTAKTAKKSDYTLVAEGTTASDGKYVFNNLHWGTYYLKETVTPAAQSTEMDSVKHKKGDSTTETEIKSQVTDAGFYPIEIGKESLTSTDPKKIAATLIATGYTGHRLIVVDQNGKAIAGKTLTLTGKFARTNAAMGVDEAGKAGAIATFVTTDDPVEFTGMLIPGEKYVLKGEGFHKESGTNDQGTFGDAGITLLVGNDGTISADPTVTKIGPGNITAIIDTNTYGAPTFKIVYASSVAQIEVELDDQLDPDIIPKNAKYDLYAAATDTAPDADGYQKTTGSPFSTDEEGVLGIEELSVGYYYLVENTAPVGYKPQGTTKRFVFRVYQKTGEKGVSIDYSKATACKSTLTGAEELSGTGDSRKILYDEKPVKLTITRSDLVGKTGSLPTGVTAIKYTLYVGTTATGTGREMTLDLTTGSATWDGLRFGEQYCVVETTTVATGSTYTKDSNTHLYTIYPLQEFLESNPDKATVTVDDTQVLVTTSFTTQTATGVKMYLYREELGTGRPSQKLTVSASGVAYSIPFIFKNDADGSEITVESTNAEYDISGLVPGATYTVTQGVSLASLGYAMPSFKFTVAASNGWVTDVKSKSPSNLRVVVNNPGDTTTSGSSTGTSVTVPTIWVYEPYMSMSLTVVVDCSEGYSTVNKTDAFGIAEGISFGVYSDSDCKKSVTCYNDDGNTSIATDEDGFVSINGLNLANTSNTYYLKVTGVSSKTATMLDTNNVKFKITPDGNGGVESVTKSTGNWIMASTMENKGDRYADFMGDEIIGKLKHTDLSFYAVEEKKNNSNKTTSVESYGGAKFSVYRANESELDEEELIKRLNNKMLGNAASISSVNSSSDWELLTDDVQSGSNGLVSISDLIPGQKYLVKQTYPSASGKAVIFSMDTSNSGIKSYSDNTSPKTVEQRSLNGSTQYTWLVTSSTSSSSSSASTGSTLKTTGSGTQASGSSGAGNARGSATGDESNLWLHLIVMLLAFDGLVADLLYISRKKQLVPVKTK